MRDILFRGKNIFTGEWLFGGLVNVFGASTPVIVYDSNYEDDGSATFDYSFVDFQTIGQYTGLTDKNGKKIFEGDIVEFDDETWESYYTDCGTEYNSWEVVNYGVVGFDNDRGCYDFVKYKFDENSIEADLHENKNIEFCEFISELEIIGNIHDNPELLKGESNNESER